jgi:hypothetical protein
MFQTHTYLYEVGEEYAAELLFKNEAVGLVVVAAADEGREEDVGETRVTEILEGQRAQLLQNCRRLTGLQNDLEQKTTLQIWCH